MRQFAVIVIVLFIAAAAYYFFAKPPQQLSVKDLHPVPVRVNTPKDTARPVPPKPVDSSAAAVPEKKAPPVVTLPARNDKTDASTGKRAPKSAARPAGTPSEVIIATPATAGKYYYIIIESFKTIAPAKERAERLRLTYRTDMIILPTPPEGYYRLSFGRYTTEEAARAVLPKVKNDLKADAWILPKAEKQ